MECLKCGFRNPANAKFCAGCGKQIGAIVCGNCATDNAPGSRFCIDCGQPLAADPPQQALRSAHAERRILTVLFCDLVDSTVLVDNLDPELSRSIIRDFQLISKDVIERLGGRVSTYLGDGIVALFARHESNAERAINTALQIIREIAQTRESFSQSGQEIQVRCGIATGLAVVGDDMLGQSRMRLETAIGLPLNLAARIQGLAEPNGVAVGETSYQMTRGLFEFEDIGQHALKGIKEPQQVWRVVREKSISSRFVAHAAELTPMVDRSETLQTLMEFWNRARLRQAQTVFMLGEAGVGKSRVVQEVADIIAIQDEHHHPQYQCSPYHTNTALHPVIMRLKAAAGIEQGDSPDQQLDKLETLIRGTSTDFANDMPVFVELFSLPAGDRWPHPYLDPEDKKEWIFSTLINNLLALSESKPVLVTLEDVHWIDPTTLDLLSRMVEAIRGHAIFLLVTSREGFDAPIQSHDDVTQLELERLPPKYAERLLNQVQGRTRLPGKVLDEILQRTEGIPLFIEELSKNLMEMAPAESRLGGEEEIVVPATLRESLLARLDRLPEGARTVAHLAAVIGRDFSFDLLEKVGDYQDKNLYRDLTPLLKAQMVFQRKPPPNAEFSFKHALFRDVAYETLLKSDLVGIHKRIADVIESDYPDVARNSPELVARHCTEGHEYQRAVQYWLKAGQKASRRSSNIEAGKHFNIGISLLPHLDNKEHATLFELKFLLALGPIYMSTYGTGAGQTHDVYMRAYEISNMTTDSGLKFIALWNRWRISVDDGFPKAVKWADELLDLAKETQSTEQLLQAHHCQWGTLYNLGEQQACCEHVDAGITYYSEEKNRYDALTYGGHDPKVCGHGQSALSLWLMGEYQKAEDQLRKGEAWSDSIDHLGTRLHLIDISLMYYRFRNEPRKVLEQVEELQSLIDVDEFQDYGSKVKIYSGWAYGMLNGTAEALAQLNAGVAEHAATGTWEDKPVFLEMSAQINYKLGRYEKACEDTKNALESAGLSGVAYWNAELHRRRAVSILASAGDDHVEQAKQHFLSAIDIATRQHEHTLALRAAMGLARMYLADNEKDKAASIVTSILEKFPAGAESPDLSGAASILEAAG